MPKANLLLKNDVGLVLDITESPLGCTVYDLEGNEIAGSGGGSALTVNVTDFTFDKTAGEVIEAFEAGSAVIIINGVYEMALMAITKTEGNYAFIVFDPDNFSELAYACESLDGYPMED